MNLIPSLSPENLNELKLLNHPIFSADSYKYSHFFQLNPDATKIYSHYINRGSESEEVFFCGLNDIITDFLSTPLTIEHLYYLKHYCEQHGIPSNMVGFNEVITRYRGYLPVEIKSVPELALYPCGLPLFTIENTGDATTAWVTGFVETLLMKVWYPSAVATKAYNVKRILKPYYDISSEDPGNFIDYGYVNFGSRAATCEAQAVIGGMAHLHSFKATDAFKSIASHSIRYGSDPSTFTSIPASEHSVVSSNLTTAKCKDRVKEEIKALTKYVETCISMGYKLFAWVIDTTDHYAIAECATDPESPIRKLLEDNDAKLILRPDSGNQLEVLDELFDILTYSGVLYENSKGYFTSDNFSVIWGDGTTSESIELMSNYWVNTLQASMDILAFGSGGDLIQNVGRDDHKTAIKASSMLLTNGDRVGINKQPIGDSSKKSLKGRVVTCKNKDGYFVDDLDSIGYDSTTNIMKTVYRVG